MNMKNNLNERNTSNANIQFYEEMLLRYIANQYVEHENDELEQVLKQLEDFSNKEIDIEKLYKKETKRNKNTKHIRLYKAGSIVAAVLIIMLTVIATVPPVRAAVLDFFIRVFETHTDISAYPEGYVVDAEDTEIDDRYAIRLEKEYGITYLPEGFHLSMEQKDAAGIVREYVDSENNYIMFSQLMGTARTSVDTEDAELKYVDINGLTVLMGLKRSENEITIDWKKDNYMVGLSFIGVDEEEALKVARSVQ